jgi:hypothetical protein
MISDHNVSKKVELRFQRFKDPESKFFNSVEEAIIFAIVNTESGGIVATEILEDNKVVLEMDQLSKVWCNATMVDPELKDLQKIRWKNGDIFYPVQNRMRNLLHGVPTINL